MPEVVASGVDLVTFSGDKLLGGPQAGIVVGKQAIVSRLKKNPWNRALRIDKFTIAALEATLTAYEAGDRARDRPDAGVPHRAADQHHGARPARARAASGRR